MGLISRIPRGGHNWDTGRERIFTGDLIVLVVIRQAVNDLVNIAGGLVEKVYAIGDGVSPRRTKDAIWEVLKQARIALYY
jgi:hypothetical protein